jgi:hypothetical protein
MAGFVLWAAFAGSLLPAPAPAQAQAAAGTGLKLAPTEPWVGRQWFVALKQDAAGQGYGGPAWSAATPGWPGMAAALPADLAAPLRAGRPSLSAWHASTRLGFGLQYRAAGGSGLALSLGAQARGEQAPGSGALRWSQLVAARASLPLASDWSIAGSMGVGERAAGWRLGAGGDAALAANGGGRFVSGGIDAAWRYSASSSFGLAYGFESGLGGSEVVSMRMLSASYAYQFTPGLRLKVDVARQFGNDRLPAFSGLLSLRYSY